MLRRVVAFFFSKRSIARLTGVHPALVAVMQRAILISNTDFAITEGLRTLARERQLLAKGATRTLRSRHLDGHAVDVEAFVEGKATWQWSAYVSVAAAVATASEQLEIPTVWGGSWRTFRDGTHFELARAAYP